MRKTYALEVKVAAMIEIPVVMDPIIYTTRSPNLLAMLATMGPLTPQIPIKIDPTSEITTVF